MGITPPDIQLLPSPWEEVYRELVNKAEQDLLLCAPFVQAEPLVIAKELLGLKTNAPVVHLITNLAPGNLLSGVTNLPAIMDFCGVGDEVRVSSLPSLHAKVYVADTSLAVVTSGNLTPAGLRYNREYGVRLSDPLLVADVRRDVMTYRCFASRVSYDQLSHIETALAETLDAQTAAGRSRRSREESVLREKLSELQAISLRTRAAGRSAQAIYSEALLHLLLSGPLATSVLQPRVQAVHPDLCDDSIDRVIDGQHFGKRWKHAVRSAQQSLKRNGLIIHRNEKWELTRYGREFLSESFS